MTISYHTQRYEPDGSLCCDPVTREQSPGQATVSLVRYELGYGGRITDLQPTSITVRTSCMGRYDITRYSGTETEMRPLLLAVGYWLDSHQQHGEAQISRTVNQMMLHGQNLPIYAMMMSTLMFSGWVSPVLCAAAGLSEDQICVLLTRKPEKDVLDPIIELIIDGSSVEECLALIDVNVEARL